MNEKRKKENDRLAPAMSVILIAPDGYKTLSKTVEALRRQKAKDQLEIIIVTPNEQRLGLSHFEMKEFHQFKIIEVGPIVSTGQAEAVGVRNASSPIVVYVEDHSYPAAGWAEALIRAHKNDWAAVGCTLKNANPDTAVSLANFLTDFAPWMNPIKSQEASRLAPHHTSYKREVLLRYGDELGNMLETEAVLHMDLQKKGGRLYLESAAESCHVNISLLSSYIRGEFYGGRVFGAARANRECWSLIRRLIYIAGSPLIPFVRLRRILHDIKRTEVRSKSIPRVLSALAAGLISHTVGEIIGYSFGALKSAESRVSVELHRFEHLTKSEALEYESE